MSIESPCLKAATNHDNPGVFCFNGSDGDFKGRDCWYASPGGVLYVLLCIRVTFGYSGCTVRIPEDQLKTWTNQGGTANSIAAHNSIRTALEANDSPLKGRNFEIFLQGSYKKSKNIRADSDVDVVVRSNEVFYKDLSRLTLRHGDIRVTMNYGDAIGEGLREASAKAAAKAIPQ